MIKLDVIVTQALNGLAGQNAPFDAFMISIATVGIPFMVLAVMGQWWSGADRPGTRHVLVSAGLSFLLGLSFNQMLLLLVDRARPYAAGVTHLIVPPSADPSFPSDHATAALAIAVSFALGGMPRRARWLGIAALLVSMSRVFIGTHYVSDVLGGWLTGAAAAMVVVALYRRDTRVDHILTSIL